MSGSESSPSADEVLARRESLRELGVEPTLEQLCGDMSTDIREEVKRRLEDVLAAELAFEVSWGGDLPVGDAAPFTPAGCAGRYLAPKVQVEGGMGVLCVAHDVELDRLVAYKVMKPGQDHGPGARERFFNEAEITARLAHPGIVPVFGRVIDDSGLPAYATEYIRGKTLAAALERLHAVPSGNAAERDRIRTELLRALIATCQIVAYAHTQNVVHGDIKPLNIMIDDFGAVRLVDWGVATILDSARAAQDATGWTGSRPGTPTFMSSFDTPSTFASDIYALGLTLRWILVERPDPPAGPFLIDPGAHRALLAVVRKASSGDHADRYRSAAELARDIQDVLDDRPIAVFRDPLATRVRRWASRHRPAVAAMLALLFAAAVAGPLVGTRERRLRQRADAERLQAVRLTGEMLDQAELVGRFQATLPGARAILDRAVRHIDQLARDGEAEGADPDPVADNYYRAGLIHSTLNQLAEAAECYRRSIALAARRFEAAPDDADNRNRWAAGLRDWGVTRFAQGHADEAAAAWNQARTILEPVARRSAGYRWNLARIHLALGNLAMLARDQPMAQARFRQALELASNLVEEAPADPRYAEILADVECNQGISLQMEALPDGKTLADRQKLATATATHGRALERRRRLARLEPGNPEHLADVAASLNHMGNVSLSLGEPGFADAETFYREARAIVEALAIAYPGVPANRRELAKIYSNLNVLGIRRKRPDEVLALAKAGVELFSRLVADYPDTADLHSDLGVALEQLATNLRRSGDVAGARDRTYAAGTAFGRAFTLTREPALRSSLARKSLALLRSLETAGYFKSAAHAAALGNEPAFAELRTRPGFPVQ